MFFGDGKEKFCFRVSFCDSTRYLSGMHPLFDTNTDAWTGFLMDFSPVVIKINSFYFVNTFPLL